MTVYVHIDKLSHHLYICIFVVHKRHVAKILCEWRMQHNLFKKELIDFESLNCPSCKVTNNFQQICHFHAGYRM